MSVRFRIRTAAGQELTFASEAVFEDFVRSGDLAPDDLVYDSEDGSWAPARTHPLVLEIQYEEEEADAASGADVAQAPESADTGKERVDQDTNGAEEATKADEAFGLSLAPEGESPEAPARSDDDEEGDPDEFWAATGDEGAAIAEEGAEGLDLALSEGPSAEEAQRAFLEKMKAERESALDDSMPMGSGIAGLSMDDPGTLGDMIQEVPAPRAPDPPPPTVSRPPSASTRPSSPALRGSESGPRARPAPKKKEATSGGGGRALLFIGLLAILAGGGYVGWGMLGFGARPVEETPTPDATPEPEPDPEPVVEPDPPPPEPVIASTPAAVRERAQERYLASTQDALRDLVPIPEIWPTGPYLAVPTDYPEVVDVWQDYLATARDVGSADAERYRTAYEAALDDAAIVGEARAPRLEAALAAFASTQALRDAHFGRVESLASAALQSHNALVEAEGLIFYDATGSTGPAQGIARGTSGRDADAQQLLNQVVELLEASLAGEGQGPRTASNVRQWVWDGFLDAATR